MAQAFSLGNLITATWFRLEDIPSRLCGRTNVELKYVFSSALGFYPTSNIPQTLYNHLHVMSFVPEEQTVMAWKPSKRNYE
jgi:hypothetical protein